MNKSMYSLILLDEVVEKIDEAAYRQGLSRSGMVNRILADFVSYTTPQQRIENIFRHLSETVENIDLLQVQQTSNSMMLLRSALNYKYNPTMRYSVEFGTEPGGYCCRFKAVTRTQSHSLIEHLNNFYHLWSKVEGQVLQGLINADLQYQIADGSFSRRLMVEQKGCLPASQQVGSTIGSYIHLLDSALKVSLSDGYNSDGIYENITQLYRNHLKACDIII